MTAIPADAPSQVATATPSPHTAEVLRDAERDTGAGSRRGESAEQQAEQQSAQEQRPARRAVSDYSTVLKQVQALGLLRKRPGYYITKMAILGLTMAAIWVGFALLGTHWAQVAIAVGLAVVLTQVLFMGHDAAHRAIFRSGKANEWTALILGTGIGGISVGWWNTKHTRHHGAPNQIGKDPDISSAVVRFYQTEHPHGSRIARFIYTRQGWWFYPLLMVEALHLHLQSIYTVATRRDLKHRWAEAAMLTVRLGAYPAVLFTFLPWGMATAFLAVQLAVTGLYLGSAFAVSHIGMPIVPKDSKIDFLRRQILMSRNISGGRTASLAMGGLNYQIEHHLFPSMPRPSLRHARTLVLEFCRQHRVDYHEIPIHHAWVTVGRHLNKVGIPGAMAASCPTSAALR